MRQYRMIDCLQCGRWIRHAALGLCYRCYYHRQYPERKYREDGHGPTIQAVIRYRAPRVVELARRHAAGQPLWTDLPPLD